MHFCRAQAVSSGPRTTVKPVSSTLLRMGFTRPLSLQSAGELLPRLFILTLAGGFLFCCTFLKVAFTGSYPASCPVEPGLSSCAGLSPDSARDCLGLRENMTIILKTPVKLQKPFRCYNSQ